MTFPFLSFSLNYRARDFRATGFDGNDVSIDPVGARLVAPLVPPYDDDDDRSGRIVHMHIVFLGVVCRWASRRTAARAPGIGLRGKTKEVIR